MNILDIIEKKRDAKELNKEEIEQIADKGEFLHYDSIKRVFEG